MGAVLVVHAYINANSTHQSETKITDKCFEILFLIFYTIFNTKNVLTTV